MPSPTIILAILLAIAVAGDGLLAKLYVGAKADAASERTARLDFVAGVKVAGDAQNAKAAAQKATDDKRAKEKDDANKKDQTALAGRYAAALASLRARSGTGANRGSVSAFAAVTGKSAKTCYDSAAVDRAVSDFRQGVLGVLNQGDQAITDLTNAREWAQKQPLALRFSDKLASSK